MVSINKIIAPLSISVDVKHNMCRVVETDSGVGKSFYSRLICDILNKQGLLSLWVNYSYLNLLNVIINGSAKYNLIILDEYELYMDKVSIKDVASVADNVWVISRCYLLNEKLQNIMFDISKDKVVVYEYKNFI